ncbi:MULTISPECIES: tyrosine-type recombinase/integrase [Pseudomonas]|uniref:Site-specific integrase n=2 Tax=Pseudomonas veronii TaxID=76761 RepID=A0A7Y1FCY4_PSEVE|nr:MULTISPECIES: site-specific integrase [Pseudomonas]MBV4482116.1 site-specific integrase [Pseudomonas khavaziana]NMY13703.1 site-specific integrase [Pseudomonas veronii]
MKLIFSTESFEMMGRPYPKFPLILGSNMHVVSESFEFLIDECVKRGRVQSEGSWQVYGGAIYDFLAFCEANELDWMDSTDRDNPILAIYRDWSLTECGLAPQTVNARLRIVIKLYKFALRKKWICSLPYRIEEIRVRQPKGFLAHTDTTGGYKMTPDVLAKSQKTRIGVLTHGQVSQLLSSVSNTEHLLITRLALATGLRKQELLTFPVKYVRNPAEFTGSKYHVRVDLDPGDMTLKGGKPRGIDVPTALMTELWRYVQLERGKRSSISGLHQSVLFLNSSGLPWSSNGRGLNKVYKDLGLPFDVRPHILRHTYATHSLYLLRKLKTSFDPLMYIRDRMGHASLSTTEKYLHYLDILESNVMDEFQSELDNMCRGIAQ